MAISNYNLCLAGTNYGVAVGKKSTGTQANPKFEVKYNAEFEESVSVAGAVSASSFSGNGSSLQNVIAQKVLLDSVPYQFRIGTSGTASMVTFIL